MGLNQDPEQVVRAATQHAHQVHRDTYMHPECATCAEFLRELIEANGLTVDAIIDQLASGQLPADHPGADVFHKMFSKTSLWD